MPFEIIAAALSALAVILLIVLLLKKDKRGNGEELRRGFSEQNERLVGTMDRIYRAQREKADDLERRVAETAARSENRIETVRREMNENLRYLNERNEKQLEEMRRIVEEKLQTTLENRLSTSFQAVSDHLDQVSKGIGEVRRLAENVGDIKKVFTNVKLRGTWGETQLGTLLEQMLSPEQYRRNVRVDPRGHSARQGRWGDASSHRQQVSHRGVSPSLGDGKRPRRQRKGGQRACRRRAQAGGFHCG